MGPKGPLDAASESKRSTGQDDISHGAMRLQQELLGSGGGPPHTGEGTEYSRPGEMVGMSVEQLLRQLQLREGPEARNFPRSEGKSGLAHIDYMQEAIERYKPQELEGDSRDFYDNLQKLVDDKVQARRLAGDTQIGPHQQQDEMHAGGYPETPLDIAIDERRQIIQKLIDEKYQYKWLKESLQYLYSEEQILHQSKAQSLLEMKQSLENLPKQLRDRQSDLLRQLEVHQSDVSDQLKLD